MSLPGAARRGRGKIQLCMTPMIDIVFNLLIFFLLMPSFEATEGYLPTNLPNTDGRDGPVMKQPEPVRIDLWQADADPEGVRILLNRETVGNVGELRSHLRDLRRRRPAAETGKDTPVLISPDMTVWHKHVVAAFDAAVDAGFKKIEFAVPR